MYCDYEELENYAAKLNQMFKEINEVMKSLENSYKTITNYTNWNAETSRYFANQIKKVSANMDGISTKFFNIKGYLNTVANNYREADHSLGNFFQF